MARDSALMEHAAASGESVFSVYSWSAPTLSLGRNQHARDKYDRERLRSHGVGVVRRPTGGRAILHDREITYSVAAPSSAAHSLRESYARVNAILLEALVRLGINASVAAAASPAAALFASELPCFAEPSEGEIVAGGRKLVGSAQWCDEKAFLQHGSILVDDDQRSLADFAAGNAHASVPPPATLNELLGRSPDTGEFASLLFESVRDLEHDDGARMNEEEIRPAALERVPHFLDSEWTWRR